ncbi:Reverse transcriptase RNA-dependent DNA polymerase, partial [Trinorchestia longiramus]
GSGTKGYRLYDFNAKRVLLSIDVVFNESQFISFEKEPSKEIECVPCSFPQEEKHEDSEGELELRRSTRNRASPYRFGEWVCFVQDKFDVPVNIEEALHGPESKLWKAAIEEEIASMNINNVWSLVECPKNKKRIRCKWIFKKKTGPDGNVCSYKARLVAQGYAQKFRVDYDETFSPVVRFESELQMILEIVDGYSRDFKVKFVGDKSKVIVINGDETDRDREWNIGEVKMGRTKELRNL